MFVNLGSPIVLKMNLFAQHCLLRRPPQLQRIVGRQHLFIYKDGRTLSTIDIRNFQNARRFTTTQHLASDEAVLHSLNYPPLDRNSIKGHFGKYEEEYKFAQENPQAFWAKVDDVHWYKKPTIILDGDENDPTSYRWFPDGKLNMSYNCLDVHVKEGRGNQVAIQYDSPVTNQKESITYQDLLNRVATFAGGMQEMGVTKGDRVVIYMPMIPEAIVSMLACCRIGAIHSVVFGGFAAKELASRISDCQPKIIVSASCGVEPTRTVPYKPLLDQALEMAKHDVQFCIIKQRQNVLNPPECQLGPKDLDYDEFVTQVSNPADAVQLSANDTHYILYTSGTTGLPKGVVRDLTGAVPLKHSMSSFYNNAAGDVFWAASDIGWVVGHSYICYAPLLKGCTSILYEGKPVNTPDAGAFWRVIEEHGVKTLFTAPTAFRAIKQADPKADLVRNYNLSSLKTVFLAGEHSDPDTLHWCEKALKLPVIDHWWQTELGHPGCGNPVGLGLFPIRYGACAGAVPGYNVAIAGDDGKIVPPNTLGDMLLKLPLPPGTLASIYNDHDHSRYVREYNKYPGYYDTGDCAWIDDDGYIWIMGRTDDIINTAGHRLSTGTMEELLMEHNEVSEACVIAVDDPLKGQVPAGFVIVNSGSQVDHQTLKTELIQSVRDQLGPVASFKLVAVVTR